MDSGKEAFTSSYLRSRKQPCYALVRLKKRRHIVSEHEERAEGEHSGDCPICRGDVSSEFIAMVEDAAAQAGRAMTAEEAKEWLRRL